MLNGLVIHLDLFDTLGVDIGAKLLAHGFAHNEETGHLNAAAGTAGTGTNKHQQHQDQLGGGGPQIKVTGGIAGGGNDRSHLKKYLGQRVEHALTAMENIDKDHRCSTQNDQQISTDLFHGESILEVLEQNEIIGVEVNAEQHHKDGNDPLAIGRIAGDAVILYAKAAGARRAEAMGHCFKGRHTAQQQQQDLDQRQSDINDIQDAGGIAQTRYQLAHRGAGALGPHQVDVAAAVQRHHRQHKHQNTHTADPVGEAAPEQGYMAQGLHIA